MIEDRQCWFSTAIDEITMTCSPKPDFDFNGFPVHECSQYPCEKIKEMQKAVDATAPHASGEGDETWKL